MSIRIAHFVPSFSELSETFVFDLVSGLNAHGFECHVVTERVVRIEEWSFPRVHLVGGGRLGGVRRVVKKATASVYPALGGNIDALGSTEVIRQIRPDVIWSHFGPAALHAEPAALRLHVPHIATFYGHDIYAASSVLKARFRRLFQGLARVNGASRHIAAALVECGAPPARTDVLYNGIDPAEFPYSDPARRFDGRVLRLLQVGRLVEKKNPFFTIRAVAALQDRFPSLDVRLRLVGDGPLRDRLGVSAERAGLNGRVEFLGALGQAKVRALMADSHIYVQPGASGRDGDQEGLGRTFCEASCSGLPIVSTRHGGIPEAVLDGVTGYLAEEDDFGSFVEKLAALASAPAEWARLGAAGRKHVLDRFHIDDQIAFGAEAVRAACREARQ